MQQQIAPTDGSRLSGQRRTSAHAISEGRPYFDAAEMAGHGHATTGRTTAWGNDPLDSCRREIDFVRRSYLGLDTHPVVVASAIEAIEVHRSLHWSSARTRLKFDLLGELEELLSEIFSARVLAFSSGMLANLGAMPILATGQLTGGTKPVVVFDQSAHISLTYHKPMVADETRVETIAHNDIDALERLCRKTPVVAYVCDGVYPMGGYSPIRELRQLQERYGLFLYIDDGHGISILGRQGEGFARSQIPQVLGNRTIIAASLAKGFGASGGVLMLGAADQEALFRRFSIPYAFSMPPNLAAIGAALGSCKIHRSAELGHRQRQLAQRIHLFDRRVATAEQGNSLPIRTITIGSKANAIAIARELLDCGFYTFVTSLPAVGQGKAGIRVCITAEHAIRDIERLCDSILHTVAETTGKPYPLR
ncbi:aminotransferase class I/II-fold pyridoxal phosphate-dependent enzyme [Bradyrhizobium sp. CSA112]|uniref:aminotransferase class I/II-fold pyridoxal phosphate-dependent enzyme n=1 Tax=Bradyrhizobium sp. CSA112 TaxID=2699170 RepID=UPI0023B1C44E|nr:aminotransferase class I/II-fold pyridoxal phosphate-dependent enzyme [Bradyrhizobium sp. CSA112]MDE5458924.1 aminotransferase class I/II-fold pyridoxal phosphate-dependent enzyme [Bradyrhizobium sp. CSA112]